MKVVRKCLCGIKLSSWAERPVSVSYTILLILLALSCFCQSVTEFQCRQTGGRGSDIYSLFFFFSFGTIWFPPSNIPAVSGMSGILKRLNFNMFVVLKNLYFWLKRHFWDKCHSQSSWNPLVWQTLIQRLIGRQWQRNCFGLIIACISSHDRAVCAEIVFLKRQKKKKQLLRDPHWGLMTPHRMRRVKMWNRRQRSGWVWGGCV